MIRRFGEKLRELRRRHGLTIQQLAAELGYAAHSYLSELETNKKLPTVEFVLKVSSRFGVTTDTLLKDELELPRSSRSRSEQARPSADQ